MSTILPIILLVILLGGGYYAHSNHGATIRRGRSRVSATLICGDARCSL